MKHTIGILLGAGASKPFGVPTTGDMAKEYLKITKNKYLKEIYKDVENADIESVITTVHQIKDLPNNLGIKLLSEQGKDFSKLLSMCESCKETEKEIAEFIRNKCLNPDITSAIQVYTKLLNLQNIATLKIFSTNYDVIVEEVCNKLKLGLSDGFVSVKHEYQKIFDIFSLNKGNIQLYKLHGSVNWWSEPFKQKIFNLAPDLEGTGKYTNLMIYPAQKEDVFNFPYNILQWTFSLVLNNLNELIAIGHKFGDPNITATVNAALENPDFKLILVNSSASKIKEEVFGNHERVEAIDKKFEDWIPEGVKALTKSAKKQNEKFDAIEKEKIAEKEKIKESQRKIQDLEEQVSDMENKQRDWTGSGIITSSNDFLNPTGVKSGIHIAKSNDFILGDNTARINTNDLFGNIRGNAATNCPNCAKVFSLKDIVDGKCPHCGYDLGFA